MGRIAVETIFDFEEEIYNIVGKECRKHGIAPVFTKYIIAGVRSESIEIKNKALQKEIEHLKSLLQSSEKLEDDMNKVIDLIIKLLRSKYKSYNKSSIKFKELYDLHVIYSDFTSVSRSEFKQALDMLGFAVRRGSGNNLIVDNIDLKDKIIAKYESRKVDVNSNEEWEL